MRFKSLWALRVFAKPLTRVIVLALVVFALTGLLDMYSLTRFRPVFDGLFGSLQQLYAGRAGNPQFEQQLATIMGELRHTTGIAFLCFFGAAAANAAAAYLGVFICQHILVALRQAVFDRLQQLSLSYYEGKRSGELISRINNDTMVLQRILSPNLARLCVAPLAIIAFICAMVYTSPVLTVQMLVMIPLIGIATNWLGGRVRKYGRAVLERLATLTAVTSEVFQAIRVVRIFGMEPLARARFANENEGVLRNELRAVRLDAANVIFVGALTGGAICSAILLGGHEISQGRVTGGGLLTFIMMMAAMASQISFLSRQSIQLQNAEAAAERTLQILGEQPEITEAADAVELSPARGAISFRSVGFAYDREPVLSDVNLDIAAGEVVAFAGPSGAGKTTIANLVARLYDVREGSVAIDGVDVRQLKLSSVKGNMGIVPQETVLFSASIRENIGYGRQGASEEEIVAAAKAANADDFIRALPEGYETEVGERGAKLSGGQKQRIAIARALLRNPSILILDEATSSLDTESEATVQRALQTLVKGRTTIIIAHRLSTIQNADRIVVLQKGRIVEQGTHDQLIQVGGLYQRLYETQALQEEVGEAAPEAGAEAEDGPNPKA